MAPAAAKRARPGAKQQQKQKQQPSTSPRNAIAGPSSIPAEDVSGDEDEGEGEDSDEESGSDDGDDDDDDGEQEEDDYEDIIQANEDAQTRPKKKRKRALPQQVFGSLLSSLVAAPAPTKPLRPLHRAPSEEAAERRELKQLQAKKHEREERGHVPDVIAGWTARPNVPFSQWTKGVTAGEGGDQVEGGEYTTGGSEREKELRRLAQRGAVRLFNAIRAAQTTDQTGEEAPAAVASKNKAARLASGGEKSSSSSTMPRAIKEASPAASVLSASTAATSKLVGGPTVGRGSLNVLGSKGKQEALANLSKASFLELFKASAKASS